MRHKEMVIGNLKVVMYGGREGIICLKQLSMH